MQPGTHIGPYEVEETQESGSIAVVLRVRHRLLDTVRALKLLERVPPETARRLKQEARIQARIEHPNVVSVVDVVEHEESLGLLMDFVEGFSLEACLAEGEAMDLDEALSMFRQVLAGVGAAHAKGVIHCDLKPSNIMLTAHDDVVVARVTDFGLAKVLGAEDSGFRARVGSLMGTPGYLAPEQISVGSDVDLRADIFALGVVLYEMLTGTPAFRGDDPVISVNRTVAGTYLPLREFALGIPEHICLAVDKALSPHPESRFQSCAEFAEAVHGDSSFVKASPLRAASGVEPEAPVMRTAPIPAPTGGKTDFSVDIYDSIADADELTEPTDLPTDLPPEQPGMAPAAAPHLAAATEPPVRPAHSPEPPRVSDHGVSPDDGRPRLKRTVIGMDGEEEPEGPWQPEPDEEERARAEHEASLAGGLSGSVLRATGYGVSTGLKYGGIPLLLLAGLAYFIGARTADELESVARQRGQQTSALHEAVDESVDRVPMLIQHGADATLLGALTEVYEDAATPEAKLEAAYELSGVMAQQLGKLPPAQGNEQITARRDLEMTLMKLDREAASVGELDDRYQKLERSLGGWVARATWMID